MGSHVKNEWAEGDSSNSRGYELEARMRLTKTSSDLTELALERADLLQQIERLMLRKHILGDWTRDLLTEYRRLRDEELTIKARADWLRAEMSHERATRPVVGTQLVHE